MKNIHMYSETLPMNKYITGRRIWLLRSVTVLLTHV